MKTTSFLSGLAIHVVPHDEVPARQTGANLRFGVGEVIGLTATAPFMPYASLAWSVQAGADAGRLTNSPARAGAATFIAPDVGADVVGEAPLSQPVTLALRIKRTLTDAEETIATVEFDVIRPSSGSIIKHAERHRTRTHTPPPRPNAGMWGVFMIGPADVSFQNVLFKEGGGDNVAPATIPPANTIANTMATWDARHPDGHAIGAAWMTPGCTDGDHPAYDPVTGTRMGIWDNITSAVPGGHDPAGGWVIVGADATIVGQSDCTIDWLYTVRAPGGDANPVVVGRKFCTVVHSARVTRDGTMTVTKGGAPVIKPWGAANEPTAGPDFGWP